MKNIDNKTVILAIDLQNDFTKPNGALYVKGAEEDIRRISRFIEEFGPHLDYLILAMDSHQPIHISNQCYWKDDEGYPPALFSVIAAHDVETGKWMPQYNKDIALDYLHKLEETKEVCTIWPPHCIQGGWGWSVNEEIMKLLFSWSIREGKTYQLLLKGRNQATEHYSIMKAAVEYDDDPETQQNVRLLKKLETFDTIIVMGEAADYCVANSVKDILKLAPHLASKMIIATDCMSWIKPDNERARNIFEYALTQGVSFLTSTEILALYE